VGGEGEVAVGARGGSTSYAKPTIPRMPDEITKNKSRNYKKTTMRNIKKN
jgi:hypothetical protein